MANINPGPASSGAPNTSAQLNAPLLTTPIPNGLTYAQLVAQYPATAITGNPMVITSDQGPAWWNSTLNAWVTSNTSGNQGGVNNGLFNFTAQNTQRIRAGVARVRSSTSQSLVGVVITGTAGQFSYTGNTLLFVGQVLTISGTLGGTGSITGYASPTSYLISVTNALNTFTMTTLTGAAVVTTAGTPTGLTYTAAARGMKVAMVGDSTFAGYTTSFTGGKAVSPPTALGQILNAKGIPAQSDSWFGDGRVGGTLALQNAYNPQFVGTTFANNGINTLGGWVWQSATIGANIAFTPASIFDTIDIYSLATTTGGAFTVNVDGGATLATISSVAGSQTYIKSTITCARATHVINVTVSAAANVFIMAMAVRDSTVPRVEVYNMGSSGYTAAAYVAATAGPAGSVLTSLPIVAPDVTIIDLTINDINLLNESPALYTTNIQSLITAGLLTGDVILMNGPPGGTPNFTNGLASPYVAALYALALSNNIPLIDLQTRWISYAAMQLVMPYTDAATAQLHPGPVGYNDMGAAMSLFFS